ncbi:unnamed protein product [Brassica rapa subsp. narinosa]
MPQLDKFTYFSQFFWLCLFFFTFYIFICNDGDGVLRISRILKLRNQLLSHRGKTIQSKDPNSLEDLLRKGFSTGIPLVGKALYCALLKVPIAGARILAFAIRGLPGAEAHSEPREPSSLRHKRFMKRLMVMRIHAHSNKSSLRIGLSTVLGAPLHPHSRLPPSEVLPIQLEVFMDVPIFIRTYYRPANMDDSFRYGIIFRMYDLAVQLQWGNVMKLLPVTKTQVETKKKALNLNLVGRGPSKRKGRGTRVEGSSKEMHFWYKCIGNERRSGGTCGTTYWITPVRHEAADAESAPMPLAMPCLVPRHGGGSVAGHEHRAKGRSHSTERRGLPVKGASAYPGPNRRQRRGALATRLKGEERNSHTASGEDGTTGKDRLAKTPQARSVVGLRRVSIGGKGSRTVEEPGEAGGTEKLIEYKTYLQALPYSDRSEGDRGVTE